MTRFPSTPRENRVATGGQRENGRARPACRDGGENSNARFVEASIGSGIIAAFWALTKEFFSGVFARFEDYFGANPKVRSNRLA
jgi:hypothetical protein